MDFLHLYLYIVGVFAVHAWMGTEVERPKALDYLLVAAWPFSVGGMVLMEIVSMVLGWGAADDMDEDGS